MKKSLAMSFILLSLVLSGCGGKGNTDPSDSTSEFESNESISDSQESESETEESISIDGVDDYEKWIDSWSEPGHLYVHYKRPFASDDEYDKYAVWIWPNAPLDLEGSLWGASDPNVQNKFYEMSTSWMTNIGGKGIDKDNYGKVLDIDLSRTDIVGGSSPDSKV